MNKSETHARKQPQGFLVVPRTGAGRGVSVLHAWWGLNDTMRAVCTRLSGEGFVVFAPDLYHGKIAISIPEAESLATTLDSASEQARAEIADAVSFLRQRAALGDHGLGVIGFSLGAYYALDLSVADPEHIRAVVVFYGTGPRNYSRSKAEYLGHFAETDPYEPAPNVDKLEEALRAAGRSVTFHRYKGTGHWFFEPDRREAYNQAAATLAWERTLTFLRKSLPSRDTPFKRNRTLARSQRSRRAAGAAGRASTPRNSWHTGAEDASG